MENIVKEAIKKASENNPISGKGKTKRDNIENLQKGLVNALKEVSNTTFKVIDKEYFIFQNTSKKTVGDRADVYAATDDYEIIIEIDATRADQVAKKFVSRLCYHILFSRLKGRKKLIYAALLYKGTDNMNVDECLKYFSFCNEIIKNLNDDSSFLGCVISNIGTNVTCDFYPKSTSNQHQIPNSSPFELLEKEAYVDYLRDVCGFTEGSISCYLGAVSSVNRSLIKSPNQCIINCITELLKDEDNKKKKKKKKKYLDWMKRQSAIKRTNKKGIN